MIDLSFDGAVARLRLDRPQARNALAMNDWDALAGRLDDVAASPARVLLVTGAGDAFCAGADLKELDLLGSEAERTRFRTGMRAALDAVSSLPIPAVAHVAGACYGAGVALAMACDLRIAAPGARFAITPAKIGIGYPQQDVHRLVGLVGPGQAARLLFTGIVIDGDEAQRIGLVQALGGADALDALVAAILACDGDSIAMLKRGIGLAAAGVAQDAGQDRRFDDLLAAARASGRLSRRRTPQGLPPPGR